MNQPQTTEREWVQCSCCGKDVLDTPETNLDYHDRLQDTGFGRCTECFGDPKPLPKKKGLPSESQCKKRLGWAGQMFYESRFEAIRDKLTPENQAKWDACPYAKKILIVGQFIKKGQMV